MESIKKYEYYKKLLSTNKSFLAIVATLLGIVDDENDPCTQLMSIKDYNKIIEFISLKDEKIFKFFYFNRKKVCEILYEEEKEIEVDNTINKNTILYFYLNLLINDDSAIVNYIYSLDLITKLNESQKENNNKKYKKRINSKIIIDLIKNDKNKNQNENRMHYMNKNKYKYRKNNYQYCNEEEK